MEAYLVFREHNLTLSFAPHVCVTPLSQTPQDTELRLLCLMSCVPAALLNQWRNMVVQQHNKKRAAQEVVSVVQERGESAL